MDAIADFLRRRRHSNDVNRDLGHELYAIAGQLKHANFPLVDGLSDERFSPELRQKAGRLHTCLNDLLKEEEASTSQSRGCPFQHQSRKRVNWGSEELRESFISIISGGLSLDEYKQKLHQFDNSDKCHTVWPSDFVAYRCTTCAYNPCMSLCAECFQNADHKGHDFNRFWSLAGGACDCGNEDVLDPRGFCNKHGPNRVNNQTPLPVELTAAAEFLFVKLFVRLLNGFRTWQYRYTLFTMAQHNIFPSQTRVEYISQFLFSEGEGIIELLQEFVNMGGPIIDVIAEMLINEDLYSTLTNSDSFRNEKDEELCEDLRPTAKRFAEDVKSLKPLTMPASFYPVSAGRIKILEDTKMVFNCLLDEVVFYLIRLNFPQALINLLLCLLSNPKYKEVFSCLFFRNYSLIAGLMHELLQHISPSSSAASELTNRIIHISVQICSSSNMCTMIQERVNATDRILDNGIKMLFFYTRPIELNHAADAFFNRTYELHPSVDEALEKGDYLTVNLEANKFLQRYGYSYLTTDLQNILAHKSLSLSLFQGPDTCDKYAFYVTPLQGMNVLWRVVEGNHIENEAASIMNKAFTLEWDTSATIAFTTLSCVEQSMDTIAVKNFLWSVSRSMKFFFHAINLNEESDPFQCPPYAVSFHLPLHRQLSATLVRSLSVGGEFVEVVENALMRDETFLRYTLLHPLRIHVVRAEYAAGMWVRNGNQIKISVMLYDQPPLTYGFQFLDLFLCRFIAANVDQEFFINAVFKSFHLDDVYRFGNTFTELDSKDDKSIITSKNWVGYMVDGCLRFLLDVLSPSISRDPGLENNLRSELVCILSLHENYSHSKIRDALPDGGSRCNKNHSAVFDRVLNEISEFCEGDRGESIASSHYKLKDSVWAQEFDPVLCRTRCSNQSDFNALVMRAESRDRAHLRALRSEDKSLPNISDKMHLWLGYKLPDFDSSDSFESVKAAWTLLTQPSFFYVMYNILQKWLISDQENNLVLQETIYLLSMSAKFVSSRYFEKGQCIDRLYHCTSELPQSKFPMLSSTFHSIEVHDSSDKKHTVLSFFTKEVENNESILSLLLSHYEKSEASLDLNISKSEMYFRLVHSFLAKGQNTLSRIFGTASDYIGRLLCLLYNSDLNTKKVIDGRYELYVLHPTQSKFVSFNLEAGSETEGGTPSEGEKAFKAKKLAAKRKQDALLQTQKQKHAKLMQKMLASEGMTREEVEKMETEQKEEIIKSEVYECPICNETSTNTTNTLVGLMVHVECNGVLESVLGKHEKKLSLWEMGTMRKKYGTDPPLKRTKRDWNQTKDSMLADVYSEKAQYVRLASGIGMKTCGHTAHLTCFQAYVDTLAAQQIPFDDKTYACPMCRQMVNSILPLKPELDCEKRPLSITENEDVITKMRRLINTIHEKMQRMTYAYENESVNLENYRDSFANFEKRCRQTYKFNQTDPQMSFTQSEAYDLLRAKGQSLVLGIVKNIVDHRHMLFKKGLPSTRRKFDLIIHLMYGSRHMDLGPRESAEILGEFDKLFSGIANYAKAGFQQKSPPILLYDQKCLLLRILSPLFADQNLMNGDKLELCKIVYIFIISLCLCYTILQILLRISENTVREFLSGECLQKFHNTELAKTCDFICKSIGPSLNCFFEHANPSMIIEGTTEESSKILLDLCESTSADLTRFFIALIEEQGLYMGSGCEAGPSTSTSKISQSPAFSSIPFVGLYEIVMGSRNIVESMEYVKPSMVEWTSQLDQAMFELPINTLLVEDVLEWREPDLVELPQSYDDLFSLLYGSVCRSCNTAPPNPLFCLICGELSCLDKCCSINMAGGFATNEVERHAIECGSGCSCFLSLHSSLVVIIRNSQALIWGSLYLDAYGEEDRNLKRGKPLFLSQHRLERLRRDWLEQNFNRKNVNSTIKSWFPMEYLPQILKESVYYSS